MSEDSEVAVRFKAVIGDFLSALGQASSATKEHTEKMTGSFEMLGKGLEGTMRTIGALGAILAGGAMFKEAIKSTTEWNGEVMKLSRSLGLNTEVASGMAVALHHLGVPAEDFTAVNAKMTRQMRQNEDAFGSLGIATKEANGEWRNSSDVMLDALEKINGMKAGTDRNVTAQALFGARMTDLGPLLRMNKELLEESTEKAKKYHLVVGPEGAAMTRQYKESLADLELVKKSISVQVGNVLLPILLKLGQFLGEQGPKMAEGFGIALKAVVQVFYLLKAVVETIVQFMTGAIATIIAGWKMIGEVIYNVVTGNFKGVVEATKRGMQDIKNEATATAEVIGETWKGFAKNSKDLWAKSDVQAGDPAGQKTLGGKDPGKDKGKKENPFAEWEKELAAAKAAYVQQFGDLAEFDRDAEIAFWQTKIGTAKQGSEEWVKGRLKVSELFKKADDEDRKASEKAAAEQVALAKLGAQDAEREARAEIERKKLRLSEQVALGRMTHEQELAELRKFRDEELALEMKAFDAEQKLLEQGSAKWQEVENKKTEARRKSLLDQEKLDSANTVSMAKRWEETSRRISSSLGSVFGELVKQSINMQQAMSQILKLALSELLKYAMGVVSAKAAEAGAGAASSAAQTPVIGWAMAIPAMGAVVAAVLGLQSGIGSAAGGWDIPSGVDPIAQLHRNEMVLPAHLADKVRNATDSKGEVSHNTFNIQAMDAKSFESFLSKNTGALLRVSNEAARNGRLG